MPHRYILSDFDVETFRSLKNDSQRFQHAKEWILSMTDAIDDENGVDFWQFMENNDELSMNRQNDILNTFFLFSHDRPNQVVATGTIAVDDQQMGKKLSLERSCWIGGINVHRDFRQRGIGTILFAYMDSYVQRTIKSDTSVCLFTRNSHVKHIYKQFDFKSKGFIYNDGIVEIDPTGISNELFEKLYTVQ